MSNKFRLDHSFINNKTETTSAVSKLSYEIENANLNGLPKTNLQLQFDRLKVTNEFPSNLEYIDSHTDKKVRCDSISFLKQRYWESDYWHDWNKLQKRSSCEATFATRVCNNKTR